MDLHPRRPLPAPAGDGPVGGDEHHRLRRPRTRRGDAGPAGRDRLPELGPGREPERPGRGRIRTPGRRIINADLQHAQNRTKVNFKMYVLMKNVVDIHIEW